MDDSFKMLNPQSIDKSASIAAAKAFLKKYAFWHLQKNAYDSWNPTVYKKLPTTTVPTTEIAKATLECELRTKTLQRMTTTNNYLAFLADVLTLRYIKSYQIKKSCELLAEKYGRAYCSDRSFNRYQVQALWQFAQTCPYNLLVFKC